MKIQKIKNFLKKFTSTILLCFVLFGIFIPITHAVTYNGSSIMTIPAVVGKGEFAGNNIDKKVLWTSEDGSVRRPKLVSSICVDSALMGDCGTYLNQASFLMEINTEYFEYTDVNGYYFDYNFDQFSKIRFNITTTDYNNNMEKGDYYKVFLSGDGFSKELAKFHKDTKCGTENPNICVFSLTFHYYTVSSKGLSGYYIPYIDMALFNDKEDNVKTLRSYFGHYDAQPQGFWRAIDQWIEGYKGGYGMKVADITDGAISFSIQKNETDYKFVYFNQGNFFNEFKEKTISIPDSNSVLLDEDKTSSHVGQHSIYPSMTYGGGSIHLFGLFDYESYINNQNNNVLFLDYLRGNNENLVMTTKDIFHFKQINYGTSGTDSSGNPETWNNGNAEYEKCGTYDIFCHGRNIIKIFFNTLSSLLGIEGLGGENQEDNTGFFNDLMKNAIVKWDLVFGQNQQLICDAKFNYSFTEGEKNYIAQEYRQYIPDDSFVYTLFGLFKFMNPIPPNNGEQICTYSGLKTIQYHENSWIDIVLVILFCGMILGLFYRNYN